jgi:hypothetical protein
MNQYCTALKLAINPLQSQVTLDQLKLNFHTRLSIDKDINPALIQLLAQHQLHAAHAESFYSTCNRISKVHSDSYNLEGSCTHGDYTKINWVFGGSNSVMNWYSVDHNYVPALAATPISTAFAQYPNEVVKLVHSQSVESPSVVQVGVPHNIDNPSEDRVCISISVCYLNKSERPTYQETLELLSAFI